MHAHVCDAEVGRAIICRPRRPQAQYKAAGGVTVCNHPCNYWGRGNFQWPTNPPPLRHYTRDGGCSTRQRGCSQIATTCAMQGDGTIPDTPDPCPQQAHTPTTHTRAARCGACWCVTAGSSSCASTAAAQMRCMLQCSHEMNAPVGVNECTRVLPRSLQLPLLQSPPTAVQRLGALIPLPPTAAWDNRAREGQATSSRHPLQCWICPC